MRSMLAAALAATVLVPAAADAAPTRAGCRAVLTDPKGDTYAGLHHEPAGDITAITLRSTAKTLTVATTLADVDAPLVTAPGGRAIWVTFSTGEQRSFLAKWVQGIDKTYAALSVGDVDSGTGAGSAFAGSKVADLTWSVDVKANQVRVEVPLATIAKYAGAVRKGTPVRVRTIEVYEVHGLSEYHSGGSMDLNHDGARAWRIGDC
ncbi:MAG TPA: hypothetical protein VNQ77_11790 [Frankiaceae bacterium]|nr:hypothetical protein [Frankiaceae bacterium]